MGAGTSPLHVVFYGLLTDSPTLFDSNGKTNVKKVAAEGVEEPQADLGKEVKTTK